MCNRYGYQHPYNRLVAEFSDLGPVRWDRLEPNAPRDDIRPTDKAPIIRAADGEVELVERRWGMIPWFHKGLVSDFRGLNTNARSETVATVASFKGPYARRRRLVPATYYFEWTENPDNPKGRKLMWKFTVAAQPVFAFPGLWERAQTADGPIESFTLLTSAPGPDQAPYHNRQPVIPERRQWAEWMDTANDMAPSFTGSPAGTIRASGGGRLRPDFKRPPQVGSVEADMVRPPLATRTLAQVHLEDLEPHRFEDLVRQLLYDFRSWRQLEATGRSGGDDGFDARGFEIVAVTRGETPIVEVEADDPEEATVEDEADRLWLIQCKREKSIGPAKARQYMADLKPAVAASAPYGLVIAAACDLSKRTRDVVRDEARALGFAEVHVWARGEIEDQLFQPKNDHLLFAYTGISLQVRKRSLRTDIRGRLATKRKVKRAIADQPIVLVREASDDRYPYQGTEPGHWSLRRHWNVFTAGKCKHDGLHIELVRCLAYIDHDHEHWDAALAVNLAANPGGSQDPWTTRPGMDPLHAEAMQAWYALPASQRAFYKERVVIPYDHILDVDSEGDDWLAAPHIYVTDFHPKSGPFAPGTYIYVASGDTWSGLSCSADPATRVAQFPEHVRERRPRDVTPNRGEET